MQIANTKTTEGNTLTITFDRQRLDALAGGRGVTFKMSQFGIDGSMGDRLLVICRDGPELGEWRNTRMLPKEYARVDCLAMSTIKQLQAGGEVRLPRDKNGIETILKGPQT